MGKFFTHLIYIGIPMIFIFTCLQMMLGKLMLQNFVECGRIIDYIYSVICKTNEVLVTVYTLEILITIFILINFSVPRK